MNCDLDMDEKCGAQGPRPFTPPEYKPPHSSRDNYTSQELSGKLQDV